MKDGLMDILGLMDTLSLMDMRGLLLDEPPLEWTTSQTGCPQSLEDQTREYKIRRLNYLMRLRQQQQMILEKYPPNKQGTE